MGCRLEFLAGPNGDGKSTFFEAFLKDSGRPFINADRIAAALGISDAEAAAAADAARNHLLAEGISFITETVFSDPIGAELQFLRDAIAANYRVTLHFIGVSSVQLSAARVAQRVRAGGHDVPPERLERRFRQSLENLRSALTFVPEIHVYDNSSSQTPYRLVHSLQAGRTEFVSDPLPDWLKPIIPS
ncbi:MAG TPA: zeta toxin family protein [Opitutaceae bacterium]|jgi:predicted ABC-type ATPase